MTQNSKQDDRTIVGSSEFPEQWTVFGPFEGAEAPVSNDALRSMPSGLSIAGTTLEARQVTPTRNQYDLKALYGDPPYEKPRSCLVFVSLHSDAEREATLGMGADWYFRVWLNGKPILDLLRDGNGFSPPAINDHCVNVRVQQGENMLVVHLVNGVGGPLLALGGPKELRRGDFRSILPPPDKELDAAQLMERYPPDPEAAIRWIPPKGFDPRRPDLGMPQMKEAEHVELLHCLRSNSPADEGGIGVYESLRHGTWNHNIRVFVYQDRLIGVWRNHALDENGPGCRILGRVGKVVNERGDVDWGGGETLVELAPTPVPVRRRFLKSDEDAVRDAAANGDFCIVDGRLVFRGSLTALHGVTTRQRNLPPGMVLEPREYAFERSPRMPRASFAVWDLGFRFYQEWGVRDDRFQPLSPIYKENEPAEVLRMTTELTLPLEPLVPPYTDAPLLADAPEDFRQLVRKAAGMATYDELRYLPGTQKLTHDGTNGLVHSSQYRRPDGTWVAVRENQKPKVQPFYYAAEKPDAGSFYPPARRSNLYGAVKPASGELADGSVYIVGNSPNRQSMFITVSRDGRLFDRTWFLRYERLANFTPGAMKNEGGPGAGPQYFRTAVIGRSLWMVYSISKEHIAATRVPVEILV